ncbi:MAG: DegT/DnrJ/EryC1/StrS family aminotransferase [Flavicella sp.]|nr:DegT/DnrJ/EryC1/StrS family aminotransferase [Flavicella sp.]
MINVTQTFLPPQEEYQKILSESWNKKWMTNRGVLVKRLEQKLSSKLTINNVILTANGTLPLQLALRSLEAKGKEIITTPFSYVATSSAIVWEGYKPVYADIDPEYLTIDETKIEALINKNTVAILATHVFGNPCNIDAIEKIAKKHDLKIIYDGAHSFGVNYKGKALLSYGDMSTCSFHATKIFHTGEGGCLVSKNDVVHKKLLQSHNFGHVTSNTFEHVGINAKMSELSGAMGLAVFPYFDTIILERKKVVDLYNNLLDFSRLKKINLREDTEWNYAYYPVIFNSEEVLLKVVEELNKNEIFPRRYFSPSLNMLPYVDYIACEESESVSKRVLCLPLFVELSFESIKQISFIVNSIVS